MKTYQKTALIEVVSEEQDRVLVQNQNKPEDQWVVPADVFNQTYEEIKQDFGWAIRKLKEGFKVARKGWNGKGMWIALMPSLYLDKDIINGRTKKHIGEGVDLDSQPYLVMWTASQQWQPGWLASQADMLAEDWVLIE
ncbi:DUF2829 domain-containing protein [Bacillus inaquosorum]|uniref:DUF2829 domain-containing protein n=1 Tax=Bacillus inaquosorum TaxID=483913 RepID=UPI00227E430F|nr:DUF2829 domain-containing protein [Bacillus inaquosorum]MCY9308728.1 DUF2829 domain-containing protein [Bacillus inaquosorum]